MHLHGHFLKKIDRQSLNFIDKNSRFDLVLMQIILQLFEIFHTIHLLSIDLFYLFEFSFQYALHQTYKFDFQLHSNQFFHRFSIH